MIHAASLSRAHLGKVITIFGRRHDPIHGYLDKQPVEHTVQITRVQHALNAETQASSTFVVTIDEVCITCDESPSRDVEACDGLCHESNTGDCTLCSSGDWLSFCDDCRFYAAQDAG